MIKIDKGAIPLSATENDSVAKAEKQLLDAAKLYEKQFLREMVKAMRTTVPGDGLVAKGQAEKIFQEQLDHQYVEDWGDKGGLGLQKVIYDQLIDRFGPQLGIRPRVFAPNGPIALEQGANTYGVKRPSAKPQEPDDR